MNRVLEVVRKDSHNWHVDKTRFGQLRLSALAVKGLSRACIQTYDHVAELPCITILNQKPVAHTVFKILSLLSALEGELLE
jgi:hypothetical protein